MLRIGMSNVSRPKSGSRLRSGQAQMSNFDIGILKFEIPLRGSGDGVPIEE